MKKAKHYLIALLSGVLVAATVLSGCGQSKKAVSKNDDHLTVYLWENRLMKNIVPYIHEQFPYQDIEFITGNNDTDLYSYFEEHGEPTFYRLLFRFCIQLYRSRGGNFRTVLYLGSTENIAELYGLESSPA